MPIELDQPAPDPRPLDVMRDAIERNADDEIARAFFSALLAAGRAEAAEAARRAVGRIERDARSIMRPGGDDPSGAERQLTTLASKLRADFEKKYLNDYLTHALSVLCSYTPLEETAQPVKHTPEVTAQLVDDVKRWDFIEGRVNHFRDDAAGLSIFISLGPSELHMLQQKRDNYGPLSLRETIDTLRNERKS